MNVLLLQVQLHRRPLENNMAETMGWLIDKICIAELKLYHIQEQIDRPDIAPDLRELCQKRLGVMRTQRDDLIHEFEGLKEQWGAGRWIPKVYRQFKMYNDPRFKIPQESRRVGGERQPGQSGTEPRVST